jgi:hypothetical protein
MTRKIEAPAPTSKPATPALAAIPPSTFALSLGRARKKQVRPDWVSSMEEAVIGVSLRWT